MIRILESAHEGEFLLNLCVASTHPFRWRFHTIYLINLLVIFQSLMTLKTNLVDISIVVLFEEMISQTLLIIRNYYGRLK